jgi:hypothetical protein
MADEVEVTWTDCADFSGILRSPQVEAKCEEVAHRVLAQAQAIAPVKTGAYKRSLHIEKISHAHRDTFAVVADVPYSAYVEAQHGTLARAAKAGK